MALNDLQWRPLLGVGALSGFAQIAAGVLMYAFGVYFAAWSGLVSRAVLLACIAVGTWWYVRRVLGERSTYATALVIGITITLCTALLYGTYNVISMSFVYPHFLEDMARAIPLREPPTFAMVVANNFRGFCLMGAVISAVTAIAFRRRARGRA